MESWITCGLFLVGVLTPIESLTCYNCVGEDTISSAIASVVATLPGISSIPGASSMVPCSDKSSTCTNGLFCLKHATQRVISVGGKSYTHSLYTKSCSSTTTTSLANGTLANVASGQCYQLSTSTSNQVTTNIVDCYCSNKDDCNGTAARIASVLVIVLAVIVSSFANSH